MSKSGHTQPASKTFSPRQLAAWIGAIVAATGLFIACSDSTPPEQASPSLIETTLPPAVSIREMMVGAIEPASNGLWAAALEENAPANDQDWRELENFAIQLISASSAMTLGGTGRGDMLRVQDPRWRQHSADLARIGSDTLAAVRAKDLDAVLEAGNFLIEPCSACHADFPPSPKTSE